MQVGPAGHVQGAGVRHVWLPRLGYAVRQSSSACRLESIDPVTFLDRGGRACHIKSSRDALYFVRLSSEPPVKGVPGTRTWQPIAGCLGGQDNTRQTQTVITLAGPRPGGVKLPPTTMLVSVQDTHPISPCRSSLFKPTEGRGTASASLLEACAEDPAPAGTSLWLART